MHSPNDVIDSVYLMFKNLVRKRLGKIVVHENNNIWRQIYKNLNIIKKVKKENFFSQ